MSEFLKRWDEACDRARETGNPVVVLSDHFHVGRGRAATSTWCRSTALSVAPCTRRSWLHQCRSTTRSVTNELRPELGISC